MGETVGSYAEPAGNGQRRIVGPTWHAGASSAVCGRRTGNLRYGTRPEGRHTMKTVMGWIDKIVSSLAKRKVNKDEGGTQPR